MNTLDLSHLKPITSWHVNTTPLSESMKSLADSFDALNASFRRLRESQLAAARASYQAAFPHRSLPGGRNPHTKRLRKKAETVVLQWWWQDFTFKAKRAAKRERMRILIGDMTKTPEQLVNEHNNRLRQSGEDMRCQIAEIREAHTHTGDKL